MAESMKQMLEGSKKAGDTAPDAEKTAANRIAKPTLSASRKQAASNDKKKFEKVSVIECFETDGGVNYRSNRLI